MNKDNIITIESYSVSPFSIEETCDGFYENGRIITEENFSVNPFSASGYYNADGSEYIFGQSEQDKALITKWATIYNDLIKYAPKIGDVRGGSGEGGATEKQKLYNEANKKAEDERKRLTSDFNKYKKNLFDVYKWYIERVVGSKAELNKKIITQAEYDARVKEADSRVATARKNYNKYAEILYAFETIGLKRTDVDKPTAPPAPKSENLYPNGIPTDTGAQTPSSERTAGENTTPTFDKKKIIIAGVAVLLLGATIFIIKKIKQ